MTRQIAPESIYHIYNRSVLKITIFRCAPDYARFLVRMTELKVRYPVEILAYCLMPNHFHLLLKEPAQPLKDNVSNISQYLQQLQNAYAKYFALKYKHSGRVFQGVFKSKQVKDDSYYLQLIQYIHQNPVRKKLVKTPEHWPYSSAFHNNF
jgi:putative transposase